VVELLEDFMKTDFYVAQNFTAVPLMNVLMESDHLNGRRPWTKVRLIFFAQDFQQFEVVFTIFVIYIKLK
jgi:hypothetical protein